LEALGILLPQQVMEKDAHGVHAHGLCPAEFALDAGGIKRLRLPHLQLVDRGGRRVVGADQPSLLLAPGRGLRRGPYFPRLEAEGECERGERGGESNECLHAA